MTQEANAAYDAEIALLRETVGHDRNDVNAQTSTSERR